MKEDIITDWAEMNLFSLTSECFKYKNNFLLILLINEKKEIKISCKWMRLKYFYNFLLCVVYMIVYFLASRIFLCGYW